MLGRKAPDFEVDSFDVSYGDPQTVAVTAKRATQASCSCNYRINGGATRTAGGPEWKGGERYGDENDALLRRVPRPVKGTRAGDKVKVWFSGE